MIKQKKKYKSAEKELSSIFFHRFVYFQFNRDEVTSIVVLQVQHLIAKSVPSMPHTFDQQLCLKRSYIENIHDHLTNN